MSLSKIQGIIDALRFERYRWTPVRRTYIPKKNGKLRPLGMPTWSDKLLQEVIRSLLEAYYEPQFSDHSHGFRPNRGCHTALREIYFNWRGTVWFIEGDIRGCFDNLDHTVLMSILRERILDNRLVRLIENLLKAGYMEDWKYHGTLGGSPQGGIVSPILSNIYLDRLDKFVEQTLIPANTRGKDRKPNPEYGRLYDRSRYLRRLGRKEEASRLFKQAQQLPSRVMDDPECGSRESVQVHHIRALKDLSKPGRSEKPLWVRVMAARRRKTLVVCHACHRAIHDGRPTRKRKDAKTLESRMI